MPPPKGLCLEQAQSRGDLRHIKSPQWSEQWNQCTVGLGLEGNRLGLPVQPHSSGGVSLATPSLTSSSFCESQVLDVSLTGFDSKNYML